MKKLIVIALIFPAALPLAWAQNKPAVAGRWEGTIGLPNKQLQVTVNLAENRQGEWTGSLALPDLQITDFAISKVTVGSDSLVVDTSEMLSRFSGNISSDGTTMKGDWLCALLRAVPVPMQLKRVSEATLSPVAKSTPISKELEGTWEGTAKLGSTWEPDNPLAGSTMKFQVSFATGADGAGTGILIKLGERDVKLPLSSVSQTGSSLRFEARGEGVTYTGELAGGELQGEWRQFGFEPAAARLRRVASN